MPKRPKYIRDLKLKDAAPKLGVSSATLWLWIKKGAPHDKAVNSSGGLPVNLVNVEELKFWLKFQDPKMGTKIKDSTVPVQQVQVLIEAARQKLGWTKAEIAESLEISPSTLNNYLHPHLYGMKVAPKTLVSQLEYLINHGAKHRHPHQMPSKEELINALKKSNGYISRTAEKLEIHTSTVSALVRKYDLYTYLHRTLDEIVTVKQLKKVLTSARGNLSKAARELKIDPSSLQDLVEKAHLMELVLKFRRAANRKRAKKLGQIRRALKLCKGNIKLAADSQKISIATIRSALKTDVKLQRYHKNLVRKAKRLEHPKLQEIKEALQATQGDVEKAVAKLGTNTSYFYRLLRKNEKLKKYLKSLREKRP